MTKGMSMWLHMPHTLTMTPLSPYLEPLKRSLLPTSYMRPPRKRRSTSSPCAGRVAGTRWPAPWTVARERPSNRTAYPATCLHAGPEGQPGPSSMYHGAHGKRTLRPRLKILDKNNFPRI